MDFAIMARSISVFIVFAAALAMNLEDNVVARLGMEGNYALMLTMAIIFTLLIIGRNIFVVATVVGLCLLANMPADFTLNFGFDRDLYAGIMVALLFQPVLARVLE
jgi:hypothetical protein